MNKDIAQLARENGMKPHEFRKEISEAFFAIAAMEMDKQGRDEIVIKYAKLTTVIVRKNDQECV